MDRFRIVLVILILLIIFHLFYKLLERKRNMIEPLAGELTTDMNDIRNMHNPEIILPSYKILKVANRPNDIPIAYVNAYNLSKNRLTQANKDLKDIVNKK